MTPRQGVTLTEVLVAIFIMGIGLLSLLVLFPLGALNMAQAIKDQRVTMAAQNAIALARLNASPTAPTSTLIAYPLAQDTNLLTPNNLYTNPTNGFLPANLFNLALLPTNPGIAYPVFVDPQGVILSSQRVGFFSGNTVHPGFARSNLSFVQTQIQVSRFLTVLDDITFNENGLADLGGGVQITREGRYSWAYLCRPRPSNNPPQSGADVYVVVYEKRSLAAASSNISGPPDETAYPVDYVVGNNTATLHTNGVTPNIKKGTWVLDASILDGNSQPPINTMPLLVAGNFYRILGATDDGNGSTMTLEFQTPIQPTIMPGYPTNLSITGGVMVVMEGVVEVFKAP